MIDKLSLKQLKVIAGIEPDLTEEEIKRIKERNFRYELVRFLYMEKMKHIGVNITNFHFSPGENWEETPVYDIVNSLVEIHEKVQSGEYKPIDISELDY